MEANGAWDGSSKRPKTLASLSLELAPLDSTTRGGALMAHLIHQVDVSMKNGEHLQGSEMRSTGCGESEWVKLATQDPTIWCSVGLVDPTQSHPLWWTSQARKWSLESAASSGFLNMFEHDLDVEAFPTRIDGGNDDKSVSCQTGASKVHEVAFQNKMRPSPIWPPQSFSWVYEQCVVAEFGHDRPR